MKTNLLKSAVLMASLLCALGSASAETLHARIPFGFSAGGVDMPAGNYTIRTIPSLPHVLLFENEATRMQAIVFVRTSAGPPAKTAIPLILTSGAGEHIQLANIVTDGSAYELSEHPASKSLKGASLALASGK